MCSCACLAARKVTESRGPASLSEFKHWCVWKSFPESSSALCMYLASEEIMLSALANEVVSSEATYF